MPLLWVGVWTKKNTDHPDTCFVRESARLAKTPRTAVYFQDIGNRRFGKSPEDEHAMRFAQLTTVV